MHAIAQATCLLEEAMEAFANGDTMAMMDKNEELARRKPATDACNEQFRKRYSGQEDAFTWRLKASVQQRCPNPRWSGGIPSMGGVGGQGRGEDALVEFLRSQGAPPRR